MGSGYRELSLEKIKSFPQSARKNLVKVSDFAVPVDPEGPVSAFIDALPDQLAAGDLREFAAYLRQTRKSGRGVIAMLGGHVVKTGNAPILIDLLERGLITHVAMNGAAAIHDLEIALWGETSEDVGEGLDNGAFGMADGAPGVMNPAAVEARARQVGFGEILGEKLTAMKARHNDVSLLASAFRLSVPCTVHVAIGTDIVHQHPGADGAAIGESSLRDFRIFCASLTDLDGGGAVMNLGSCVLMPEVFLKALTVVRNLGYDVTGFRTADFDMIRHYRPRVNVVRRPTASGGKGYSFTGHHEIMIPLFRCAVLAAGKD